MIRKRIAKVRMFITADRWPWIWAAVTFVLALAVVGLTVALIASSSAADAGKRAGGVAACVNNALGTRQGPAAQDNEAHIAFARAIEGLFLPKTATVAEQAAEVARFKAAVAKYVDTLVADQQERDAHPLGRC